MPFTEKEETRPSGSVMLVSVYGFGVEPPLPAYAKVVVFPAGSMMLETTVARLPSVVHTTFVSLPNRSRL